MELPFWPRHQLIERYSLSPYILSKFERMIILLKEKNTSRLSILRLVLLSRSQKKSKKSSYLCSFSPYASSTPFLSHFSTSSTSFLEISLHILLQSNQEHHSTADIPLSFSSYQLPLSHPSHPFHHHFYHISRSKIPKA